MGKLTKLPPRKLQDAWVLGLKPSTAMEEMTSQPDTVVPELTIERRSRDVTFNVRIRVRGASGSTTLSLGRVGAPLNCKEARALARDYLLMAARGDHPRALERQALERDEKARREADAARGLLVRAFLEEEYGPKRMLRRRRDGELDKSSGEKMMKLLRRYILPAWGERYLRDLTKFDVIALIDTICARGALGQAGNVFSALKTMFAWAEDRGFIEHSPAARLSRANLVGPRAVGQRVLSDDELWALVRVIVRPLYGRPLHPGAHVGSELSTRWSDTRFHAYPWRGVFYLLLLTGARYGEILNLQWKEVDLTRKVLVVSPDRHKSRTGHTIPLSDTALAEFEHIPRFNGPYVFSSDGGLSPCQQSGVTKRRIDQRMLRTLRALARSRGEDPNKVELERWTVHDIRRTVRTRLAMARVPHEVAEAVIGHAPAGLAKVYVRHAFHEEKAEALQLWANELRRIVRPIDGTFSNVLRFRSNAK